MSGICGLIYKDPLNRLPPGCLESLYRGIGGCSNFKLAPSTMLNAGFLGLATAGPGSDRTGIAKIRIVDHLFAVAFQGYLFNLTEFFPSHEKESCLEETLVHLYLKDGISFLEKLDGEFVLALWDGATETLLLATDRFRIHPLFYHEDQETLIFASRLQGIMNCLGSESLSLNPEAI